MLYTYSTTMLIQLDGFKTFNFTRELSLILKDHDIHEILTKWKCYIRIPLQYELQLDGFKTFNFTRELSLILKEIKIITDKIRDDEESAAIENDWKFAAMVLDRLCLIVFTLFTIVATVAVLAAAPHVIVT